jgi:hypothetical protein
VATPEYSIIFSGLGGPDQLRDKLFSFTFKPTIHRCVRAKPILHPHPKAFIHACGDNATHHVRRKPRHVKLGHECSKVVAPK